MARTRRTTMEKLEQELAELRDSIVHYEEALRTLKEKEKKLCQLIETEQIKELLNVLKESHISIEELKEMLSKESEIQQGA